ncbi:hypothetical protein Glove_396g78 [Diversispora epigaea]|uniref:Uncharacterized protein n=1 Tax=Diversispora epigaea TaxID=1348612 RepID=A0A397H588_9GLOM|nr:hypothetical protein Glove_396g78 [Diversispora epigaea]
MSIFLPPDVLDKIFLELRKDSLSLYSCALVNRSWCESAISYLWLQPFKLLEKLRGNHQNGYNKRSWNERAYCLIQIYVSCIQYQEKINVFSTERQRTTRQQTCNSKPPTFNYLQYLKRLDIEEFSNAILGMVEVDSTQGKKNFLKIPRYLHHLTIKMTHSISILGHTKTTAAAKPQRLGYNRFISAAAAAAASSNNTSISSNKARIFNTNILGKILRNQSVGLKSLSISNNHFEPYSWLHSLPPNTNHHLSNLSKFICTTPCNAELYYTLSETVKNLKKIKIWMDYPPVINNHSKHGLDSLEDQVKGITVLIRSQKQLTHFELGYCGLGLDDILIALISQVHSLRKMTFFKVDFKDWRSLLELTSLTQLNELILNSCFYLPNCTLNLSNNITNNITNHHITNNNNRNNNIGEDFSNSKITKIVITSAPGVIVESFLNRANISLEELEIAFIPYHTSATINSSSSSSSLLPNYNRHHHYPSTHNILETIVLYSPNLTIARLYIDSDTISKLPYFLSSCINLKFLKISGPRNQETNVNNIFREISSIKLVNNNLEVLGIHTCWTFTPENLELFLGYFTRLKKFELLWSSCVCNEHFKVLLNRFWCGGGGRRDYDDDDNNSYQRSFKKRDNGKYNNRYWKNVNHKRYTINSESFGKNSGKGKNRGRGKYNNNNNNRFENIRSCFERDSSGNRSGSEIYGGGGGGKEVKSISKLEYLSVQTRHIINVDLIRQIRRFVKYVKVCKWEI